MHSASSDGHATSGRGPTILVVEDEALIARDIKETLEELGYRVPCTTASAKEAWDAAALVRPELALVDIRLEGPVDGIEAAARLRREFSVPSIFLTSFSDDATLSRAKETLPLGYLIKPFTERDLRTAIEVGLHQHRIGEDAMRRERDASAQLQSRVDASERLATIGARAAKLAHEINNPLTYVALNVATALEAASRVRSGPQPEEPLSADLAELVAALRDARAGTDFVLELAKDVRRLAHADAAVRKAIVDLPSILDAALKLATPAFAAETCVTRRYTDAPPVEAVETHLVQVFVNLLSNAAHAVADVPVGSRGIELATRTDERLRAVVEIRDSGPGIAREQLERVFEPFFTTKPSGQGTGLGLSICRELVASLGGEIAIESELGTGTTLRVTLPPAGLDRAGTVYRG